MRKLHDPMTRILQLCMIVITVVGCSEGPTDKLRTHAGFSVDMTQDQLRAEFGEPQGIDNLIKTDESIWGPVEAIWSRLKIGENIEIWSYQVEGGSTELYFLRGSNTVDDLAFAPEGVVYEAQ